MNAKLGRIKEESIVIFKKGGKISSSGKFLYSFTLQDYVRQKFERKISLLQLSRKFGDCFLSEYKTKIFILSNKLIDTKTLRKFAFFKRVQVISNKEFLTIVPDQAFFEYSSFLSKFADDEEKLNYYIERIINNHFGNKESKYLAHSFHEYIGRFYPQIVRALINAYGDDKGTILDPFSGSGTTVIESMLMSIPVIGIELNPLQNFLTKAKLRSFNIPYEDIDASISRINNKFANLNFSNIVIQNDLIPNYEKWFRKENLQQLISIKSILEKDNINNELKIFFLLVLSSIIKEVSNWVPGQARVRLGKKPLNIVDVFSLFRKRVKEYRDLIKVYQAMDKYLKIEPRQARVHNIDARQMDIIPDKSISLIVTSPPYANALPYIETDKLAGYLLGFLKNTNYIDYINKEIGNREVSSIERVQLEEEFLRNYNSLSWGDGCKRLIKNIYLKNKDLPRENFRRRDHAAVLYKYYKGIYQTLKEMKRVLLPNGFCIIIVGNNKLRAGETLIEVKSDKYIIDMAKILGFELENVIERELTNTSNFFSKIKDESIIILKIK
jgi:site-specific DNA-methyltransferase (cytosine-N4-specific)